MNSLIMGDALEYALLEDNLEYAVRDADNLE